MKILRNLNLNMFMKKVKKVKKVNTVKKVKKINLIISTIKLVIKMMIKRV